MNNKTLKNIIAFLVTFIIFLFFGPVGVIIMLISMWLSNICSK